jgi:hypothetical protein
METTAFALGIIGTTFAIIAWERIAVLKKELEKLKKSLEDSGVIKAQPESENK